MHRVHIWSIAPSSLRIVHQKVWCSIHVTHELLAKQLEAFVYYVSVFRASRVVKVGFDMLTNFILISVNQATVRSYEKAHTKHCIW